MKPIYLEPDEEITSVIDKIEALSDRRVALVAPKNGTLLQSIVNLKLLVKEAKKQDKEIVLISTNRVGVRLAEQVGLKAYPSLGAVGPGTKTPEKSPVVKPITPKPITAETINGVTVNQYHPDVPMAVSDEAEVTEEPISSEPAEPALLPAPTADDLAEEKGDISAVEELSEKVEAGDDEKLDQKEIDSIPEPNLPPIVSRTIDVDSPRQPFHLPWKAIAAAVVILVIGLVVSYLFIPKALATVTFTADPVTKSLDLTVVSSTVVHQSNTIAGTALSATESGNQAVSATGQKNIGTAATGSITLFNKGSSNAVTLAAGTGLAAQGQTFTLDKATTIPGASVSGGTVVPGQTNNVAITATDPGTDGNISNATFSVTGQSSLVYGSGSTSGGTTKQVTILTQSDVDSAVASLKTTLQTKATTELTTKAAKQTILANSSWQSVTNQTVDQTVGAQVSSATLKMTVQSGVIAFDPTAATNAVKAAAVKDIPKGKQLSTNPKITLTFKALADNQSSMTMTAALDGFAVTVISNTKLADQISGQSVSKAIATLKEQDKANDVAIAISPSWWPKQLPFLARAIEVKQQFVGR